MSVYTRPGKNSVWQRRLTLAALIPLSGSLVAQPHRTLVAQPAGGNNHVNR
jgi:hypothetical protein